MPRGWNAVLLMFALCAICHIVTIILCITLAVNLVAFHSIWWFECRWDREFNYVGCKQGFIWIKKKLVFISMEYVVNSNSSRSSSINAYKRPFEMDFLFVYILSEKGISANRAFQRNFHKFWFNYSKNEETKLQWCFEMKRVHRVMI